MALTSSPNEDQDIPSLEGYELVIIPDSSSIHDISSSVFQYPDKQLLFQAPVGNIPTIEQPTINDCSSIVENRVADTFNLEWTEDFLILENAEFNFTSS